MDLSSLYFPVGSVDGAMLCLNFSIDDDQIFEKDDNFTIHIGSTEENVNIGPINYTRVLVIDNEGIRPYRIANQLPILLQAYNRYPWFSH